MEISANQVAAFVCTAVAMVIIVLLPRFFPLPISVGATVGVALVGIRIVLFLLPDESNLS